MWHFCTEDNWLLVILISLKILPTSHPHIYAIEILILLRESVNVLKSMLNQKYIGKVTEKVVGRKSFCYWLCHLEIFHVWTAKLKAHLPAVPLYSFLCNGNHRLRPAHASPILTVTGCWLCKQVSHLIMTVNRDNVNKLRNIRMLIWPDLGSVLFISHCHSFPNPVILSVRCGFELWSRKKNILNGSQLYLIV